MSLLSEKVTTERFLRVADPGRPVLLVVLMDLMDIGVEIGNLVPPASFDTMDHFVEAHGSGASPLIVLEGPSRIVGPLWSLDTCPLLDVRRSLLETGQYFSEYYKKIEAEYFRLYEWKSSIMDPLCIIHQTARLNVARRIGVGRFPLRCRHVACRSEVLGKKIYAEEGLRRAEMGGMSRDRVETLLDQSTGLYCLQRFSNLVPLRI